MRAIIDDQLAAVPWAEYETAYGPATEVAEQLRGLGSADEATALRASHDLWCGLCHQHVFASTAAVPALPFILRVLDEASPRLAAEILDILLGFARCTAPEALTEAARRSPPAWIGELRAGVTAERARLEHLARSPHAEVGDLAREILEELHPAAPRG
jgi:hypothetical protein